jgi:hypothetical protein
LLNLFQFFIAPHGCGAFFRNFQFLFLLTFWLYATLPAPYKALRSNAGAGNVGEGAVGGAADLGD